MKGDAAPRQYERFIGFSRMHARQPDETSGYTPDCMRRLAVSMQLKVES
jgi:hypothetical protein